MSEENKRVVVLIVEDDIPYAELCIEALESDNFKVHHASDDVQFYKIFCEIKDVVFAVVMDAVIGDDSWISSAFISHIRDVVGDKVVIIANSSEKTMNGRLMNAGADWPSGSRKVSPSSLAEIIRSVSDLES